MNFLFIWLLSIIDLVLNTDAVVQDFHWRDYVPGDIPDDAVEGAPGRYIGQFIQDGRILPATIYPYSHTAVSEQEGRKTTTHNIKIFCSRVPHNFYWKLVDFEKPHDEQMKDAVKGGFQTELGVNLFIGKAYHEDEWKIGKVVEIQNIHQGISIWDKHGKLIRTTQFYMLKYNRTLDESDLSLINAK